MPGNTEQQAQATSRAGNKQGAVRRYEVARSAAISIEVYELGDGPTIVLLPSLGRGATDMLELAEPLAAAGYRVLCPEPRGNGRSVGPLADKTLHDWAGDIAAVIEHAGQAPVVIVGHAHGNWIARTVASDRPDLVRALILLAGSAGKVPKDVDAVPIPPKVRAQIERCGDTSLPENWYGMMVPAGTPLKVVQTLNEAIRKTLENKDVKANLAKMGLTPAPSTAAEFAGRIRADGDKWSKLIAERNVKPE